MQHTTSHTIKNHRGPSLVYNPSTVCPYEFYTLETDEQLLYRGSYWGLKQVILLDIRLLYKLFIMLNGKMRII